MVERAARDHERLRALAVALVRHADDRGIGDSRVGDEHGFELGGRDLEAADLDQLLEPVDEKDASVLVDVTRSPVCSQPSSSMVAAVAAGSSR